MCFYVLQFLFKYYTSSIVGSWLCLITWSTLLDVLVLASKHNFTTQYILWLPISFYEFSFTPFNLRIKISCSTSYVFCILFQSLFEDSFLDLWYSCFFTSTMYFTIWGPFCSILCLSISLSLISWCDRSGLSRASCMFYAIRKDNLV